MTPQEALQRTIEHREIFHDEMLDLMRQIMAGEISPLMAAAILTGLRVKKETIGEISAAAMVMRVLAAATIGGASCLAHAADPDPLHQPVAPEPPRTVHLTTEAADDRGRQHRECRADVVGQIGPHEQVERRQFHPAGTGDQ